MNLTKRRQKIRNILNGVECIHPASVSDPLSMRAAELLDFEAAMFAGSVASLTVLGAPDLIVLTLSEFADQAHRINRAGNIPLIVDADHGYGNALNVKRTVEELETAGVSCLTIEDTLLPTAFGTGATEFLPIAEAAGKMKAALQGREDNDLAILGRTGCIGSKGVDEAITRARTYLDCGVDGVMFVGVKKQADLDVIARSIDAPIMLGGVAKDLMNKDYLADCGVRICLQGHQPYAAAVQAMYTSLKSLREGSAAGDLQGVASDELMKQLTCDDDYKRWTNDFLN